jgi:hypothetical protein
VFVLVLVFDVVLLLVLALSVTVSFKGIPPMAVGYVVASDSACYGKLLWMLQRWQASHDPVFRSLSG